MNVTSLAHIAQPTINVKLYLEKAGSGTRLVSGALSRENRGFNTDAGAIFISCWASSVFLPSPARGNSLSISIYLSISPSLLLSVCCPPRSPRSLYRPVRLSLRLSRLCSSSLRSPRVTPKDLCAACLRCKARPATNAGEEQRRSSDYSVLESICTIPFEALARQQKETTRSYTIGRVILDM